MLSRKPDGRGGGKGERIVMALSKRPRDHEGNKHFGMNGICMPFHLDIKYTSANYYVILL